MITQYSVQSFDTAQIIEDLQLDIATAHQWLTSPRGFNTIHCSIHSHEQDFFYADRTLNCNLHNTEFERLWNTLDRPGEAQIQIIDSTRCYRSHCDIDNRWHFNLTGDDSFLVDIENQHLWPTRVDGRLYYLNTTFPHSAVNFGMRPRIQLVIRQCLRKNSLTDPVKCWLHHPSEDTTHKNASRYLWDKCVQSWLNIHINTLGVVTDFQGDLALPSSDVAIQFKIESTHLREIDDLAKRAGLVVKIGDKITSADESLVGQTSMSTILKK